MNKLFQLVLEHRGLTEDDLASFDDPTHRDLMEIDVLADRLHEIYEDNRKIVIIPDFDMDGIMSGVVGYASMSELGFDVELFHPSPHDGYGFGETQIDSILKDYPNTKAIITCDCGISCLEGTKAAIDRGLEVLITDHHIENAAMSPRGYASAVVDPCSIDEEYEHSGICGAHVLWQCLDYYARKYSTPDKVEKLQRIRVFAGIGTISDVMPVLYENRVLIRDAVDILHDVWSCSPDFLASLKDASEPYKQAFRGLYAAYKVFSENDKISDIENTDEEFFGYYMAPAFNSVKRLDGEMSKAFGVFTKPSAIEDMRYLFALNEERKELVQQTSKVLLEQDNPLAPFCYVIDAPKGILGLLATNMMSQNNMPCVVVTENDDGSYSGSGRSPEWYEFVSLMGERGYRVAGHEGAFGCGFDDYDQLESLFSDLENTAYELAEQQVRTELDVDFTISTLGDGDIDIDEDLFIDFVEDLSNYKPFGRGFELPSTLLRFNGEQAGWRTIGANANHLKITLPGLDILCWNQASFIDEDGIPNGLIQIVGHLDINEFRGKKSAQFIGDILP